MKLSTFLGEILCVHYRNQWDKFFISEVRNVKIPLTDHRCVLFYGVQLNEKYVLITDKTQEELVKKNMLSITIATLMKLSKAKDLVPKLASNLNLSKDGPNKFWSYCNADTECVKISNGCGGKVGVQKKYQSNLEEYLKENKSEKECKTKMKDLSIVSKCVENFCT